MRQKKIIVIIPAYNEERSIKYVVERVKRLYPEVKVLVVNDGSKDRTLQEARAAGAFTVSHPYNLGIGGAVQTGYKIADREGFDIAVQIDGDAQHDPAYLEKIVSPVIAGRLDFVIGSRFLGKSSTFKSTFLRRIGINLFSTLLRILTRIPLTDPTSGFRAVNRKLIREFSIHYPIDYPEPEAIKLAKRFGARVGEVPVKMQKRLGGKSSIRYFKTLYYMVKVTFAILIDTLRKKKNRRTP